MRHDRHYTLQQANAARPWVADRVGRIRQARGRLAALGPRAREGIAALDDPQRGGVYPGRDVAGPLVELGRLIAELQAMDVVLRDIDMGLVDFPALRRGEEIYLCWRIDEEEIGFWHEPDAGFAGRRALGLGDDL